MVSVGIIREGCRQVMVSVWITMEGLSTSNAQLCGICGMKVKTNSLLCIKCGKWIHGRCVGMEKKPTVFNKFSSRKYKGNIGEVVKQEEKL